MYPSVFTKLNAYSTFIFASFPDSPPNGYVIDADTLYVGNYRTVSTLLTGVRLRASDVPAPPEAAAATLQRPTFCSPPAPAKELLPESDLSNNALNPIYPLSAGSSVAAVMPAVLRYITVTPARSYLPPLLMQHVNVSLAPLVPLQPLLNRDLLWAGKSVPRQAAAPDGNPTNLALDLAVRSMGRGSCQGTSG